MKKIFLCISILIGLTITIYSQRPISGFYIDEKEGKYGVIDPDDNIIIPFIYDDIDDRFEFLVVKIGDKYGILDDYGNTIAPLIFDWIYMIDAKGHDKEREGIANSRKDGIYYLLFRDGMCIPQKEWWKRPYRTCRSDKDGNIFYTDDRAVTF